MNNIKIRGVQYKHDGNSSKRIIMGGDKKPVVVGSLEIIDESLFIVE